MVLAIVGMAGSGKSQVTRRLAEKGLPTIRFGEFIIREVQARNLPVTPEHERAVREELRATHGMDVCARLALPQIRALLAGHPAVIIDGMYSFSEYKTLKHEFGDELVVVAVFTPRAERYRRLATRHERPLTPVEAEARDYREIEHIEKGGPIAMADYLIVNDGDLAALNARVDALLDQLMQEHSV
ncbi:MAG: AAA family ATPase [Chloroflexaceae bacterium]